MHSDLLCAISSNFFLERHPGKESSMVGKEMLDRQSITLEYKRELPTNLAGIIETCVAFSNTAGGLIVLGAKTVYLKLMQT